MTDTSYIRQAGDAIDTLTETVGANALVAKKAIARSAQQVPDAMRQLGSLARRHPVIASLVTSTALLAIGTIGVLWRRNWR